MRYDYEDMEREWIDNKVVYNGASDSQVIYGGGYDPRGLLAVGMEYEVEDCDVHSWKTVIYLKDFPGKRFNSVHFSIVDPTRRPQSSNVSFEK